jgi:hypothetical protein
MKIRRSLYISLVLLILGILGWWFWASKKDQPSGAKSGSSSNTATPNGATNRPNASNAQPTSASAPTPPLVDSKLAKMEAFMSAQNARSLDFYGKVIDQHGDPVAGVKITAAVGRIVSLTESGGEKFYAETDSAGKFSFVGIHGSGVGYLLSKDGYTFSQRQPASSRPKDYVPDLDNPMVFHMWKLQGAEPMVHTAFDSRVSYDGQTTAFDLIAGRKANGGDLRITLTRNPLQVRRGVDRFDWTVQIQMAGGGLVETSDLYPYEAPESGYQPTFDLSVAKDAPSWTQRLTKTFYVQNAKGNYGRVTIDLTTDSERPQGTGIAIETWLNPSGSRDLEFDPAQVIKP